jgi:hypothetical protein
METLNKVAHAIADAEDTFMDNPIDYEDVAEAALKALRTPSDDMMRVLEGMTPYRNNLDLWVAMIDAAMGRAVNEAEKGQTQIHL